MDMCFENLRRKIFNGKNPKFVYYAEAFVRMHMPRCLLRPAVASLDRLFAARDDRDYIMRRVDYYCKGDSYRGVPAEEWERESVAIGSQPKMRQKVYYYDTMEYGRYFPKDARWHIEPGDVNYIARIPSITKSRPIGGDNRNNVIMKLNKVRHFIFVDDNTPFAQKKDAVVFRGKVYEKEQRKLFMRRWFGHERVDAGDTDRKATDWRREKITVYEHLAYRYVMAIEGNDVASNLKWVMSSNSIAVMPRPTCETWFMEGQLVPDYHYIEVRPDFSDLLDKMDWYSAHPEEANAIIRHAHEWVAQFRDRQRERLISLLTLRKYLAMTGEIGKKG